jgi:type I restriction-modification system DNA methylase subunit
MTKEDVLKRCTIEGMIVRLPGEQLERKLYMEVAKSIDMIGGKWKGGKIAGFVFQEDPTDLLYEIANGEKRNLKKETQSFFTPSELADELVFYANILPENDILEPSAGAGAIVDAIRRKHPKNDIFLIEKSPINQLRLKKFNDDGFTYFCHPLNDDFLNLDKSQFDRIIANPPFSNNQDIDHVYQMYRACKPGGRIVTISSMHWRSSSNKKEVEFKEWLKDLNADIMVIPEGSFKESGTTVGGLIIVIDKPNV